MTDRVDRGTRHRIMAANRSVDTSPEKEVRQALFRNGLRFRINVKALPGKPDIVLPKYKAVIFVHGCFWHGHRCRRNPRAKSNIEFWSGKIRKNKVRDRMVYKTLAATGWRVMVVWECAVRRQSPPFAVSPRAPILCRWVKSNRRSGILSEFGFSSSLTS
jgi:DNA mismatch endonuclease, patch repair protein